MTLHELLARYQAEHGGSLGETVHGVLELSDRFNGITPFRPGYLANAPLRRAYVQYYLPVNAEKVARVLAELARYRPFAGKPIRVLDFGCGPGTASIAYLLAGGTPSELCLVDVVDEALEDARRFALEFGVRARTLHEPPRGETFDLILAANVWSEYLPALEPLVAPDGHLVVIEPATQTATRRLIEWRDRNVAAGFKVAAPCLGQATCPMLAREDLWCHQDIPWPRPASVAEVDRRTGFIKESLKYSYVVLTRTGGTLSDLEGPDARRLVSNLHKEKGKAWAWTCARDGPLCRLEILTRHRGPETAAFFHASRGDIVNVKVEGEFFRSTGPVSK